MRFYLPRNKNSTTYPATQIRPNLYCSHTTTVADQPRWRHSSVCRYSAHSCQQFLDGRFHLLSNCAKLPIDIFLNVTCLVPLFKSWLPTQINFVNSRTRPERPCFCWRNEKLELGYLYAQEADDTVEANDENKEGPLRGWSRVAPRLIIDGNRPYKYIIKLIHL